MLKSEAPSQSKISAVISVIATDEKHRRCRGMKRLSCLRHFYHTSAVHLPLASEARSRKHAQMPSGTFIPNPRSGMPDFYNTCVKCSGRAGAGSPLASVPTV